MIGGLRDEEQLFNLFAVVFCLLFKGLAPRNMLLGNYAKKKVNLIVLMELPTIDLFQRLFVNLWFFQPYYISMYMSMRREKNNNLFDSLI